MTGRKCRQGLVSRINDVLRHHSRDRACAHNTGLLNGVAVGWGGLGGTREEGNYT